MCAYWNESGDTNEKRYKFWGYRLNLCGMFEVLECLFGFSAFCGKLCRLFIKRHIELIDSESFLGRPQSLSQVAVMLIDCGQVRIKRRIIRIRIAQLFEILLSIFKIFLLKLYPMLLLFLVIRKGKLVWLVQIPMLLFFIHFCHPPKIIYLIPLI